MTKDLVSVILPYYNAEAYLSDAIESILSQSYTNLELLLVDNNSLDKSKEIAAKYAKRDRRVICLATSNQGVSHAHNHGLSYASGEFIARMDADDISHPDRIRAQKAFIKSNPEVGLVGSCVKFDSTVEKHEGLASFVDWSNAIQEQKDIIFNRFVELPIVNPTFFIRRSIIDTYGSYHHGDFPEDYEFLLRIINHGVKVAKLPDPLLIWRDHATRLTRTDERYSAEAFFDVKVMYLINHLEKTKQIDQPIWLWGAGKLGKRKASLLQKKGLRIAGFIDIDTHKVGDNCVHFSNISKDKQPFILSLVSNRNKGKEVKNYLMSLGYSEFEDFILMG